MSNNIALCNHDSINKLETYVKKKGNDEQQKTRVRAIIALKQGKLKQDIAKQLVTNINTITNWIKRYNEKGIIGLSTDKGGRKGGNPKWSTEIFDELVIEINKQEKYWSIPLMMQWIKDTYKKDIPEQTIWYRVDKLGYSYKSARPHPYLGNKEKQEAFKKRAWAKN